MPCTAGWTGRGTSGSAGGGGGGGSPRGSRGGSGGPGVPRPRGVAGRGTVGRRGGGGGGGRGGGRAEDRLHRGGDGGEIRWFGLGCRHGPPQGPGDLRGGPGQQN